MGAKSIIKNAIGSILLVWIFASFLLFNLNQLEESKYHASALNPFHATENPNPSKLHPLTVKEKIATENLKNEHTDFQRFLEDHPELELEQSRAAYQIEQNEQKRVNAPHHVQIQNLETKPLRNTTSTLNGAPNTILENQVTIKDLRKSALSAAAAAAAAAAAMSPEAAAAAAVLAAEFEDQGDETSRFHLALAKLRDHEIQAEAEINEKKVVLHKQCAESGRRVYKVGRRHDFQGSISDALDTLDLCKREKGDKRPFDFYWDKQFMDDEVERYLDKEIADNGMVSSIPGFRETIGIKPSLARLHRECIKHHKNRKELCSFTKRAFNFHRHYKTLNVEAGIQEFTKFAQQLGESEESQKIWPQLWVFKPQLSFLGDGVHLLKVNEDDVKDRDGLAKWAHKSFPDGKWTVQEYIRNPLTYKKRKFDLRVWAVVTSINPLRIYMLDHAMPKVSTLDFSSDVSQMHQQCMHIKMPLGPNCETRNLVKPYPRNTIGAQWTNELNWMDENALGMSWEDDVWPQIEDQTNIAILSALPKCKELESGIFKNDERAAKRYNRFVFLSPDFGTDKSGKVFMEEMNTNGFMIGDTYDEFYREQESTISVLRMLGADGYPDKWKYDARVNGVVDAFCKQSREDCEVEFGRRDLRSLIDEELHSGKWDRIFPPKEGHLGVVEELESFWGKYSGMMYDGGDVDRTKPGKLDLLTWEFVFWRQEILAKVRKLREKREKGEEGGEGEGEEALKEENILWYNVSKTSKYLENDNEKDRLMRSETKKLRPWLFD